MQSVFQVQELARQHQELVQRRETQSIFQVQELARQHQEGEMGGMQSVFQVQELVRQHLKKVRWGEREVYFTGAGAGAPSSRMTCAWRERYFSCSAPEGELG